MPDLTSYIKENAGPNFDIVECFRHIDIVDREAAEREFMRVVTNISTWKFCTAQQWAKMQVESKFMLLNTGAADTYWAQAAVDRSQKEEVTKYFERKTKLVKQQSDSDESLPTAKRQKANDHDAPPSDRSSEGDSDFNTEDCSSGKSTEIKVASCIAYSYLEGQGLEEYHRPKNARKWMVDNTDLTASFLAYRESIVTRAKLIDDLTVFDRLVLNFVCLISDASRLTCGLNKTFWDLCIKSAKRELNPLDETHVIWCHRINEAARNSIKAAKTVLRRWCQDDETEIAERYQDIYRELLKAYSEVFSTDDINEDTYIQSALLPILRTYFTNSTMIRTEGANSVVKASRNRRRQINSDAKGRKGDFSVYTCQGPQSQLVFIMECKPPRTKKSDDMVKIANCLKDCIDEACVAGANNNYDYEICGLICEGNRCRAYVMDLQFHGMYRLIEIGEFTIPYNRTNLDVMLGVFQVMDVVQEIVLNTSAHCLERLGNNSKLQYTDLTLPSFDSPVRLSEGQMLNLRERVSTEDADRVARKIDFTKYVE
ncbi:hypothetical protein BJV82DRAFT_632179 [Fennellomyces sp. T-0311]|nr:hypothetical protein BJV82DRAFT_632179 [Fennellomyces sp. T-0311]